MKIDWITFIAQTANFLILVFLLRHFLYGPILKAMQKRADRVQSQVQDAKKMKQEADREAKSYREKREELENQEKDLIQQARDKAEEERKRLMDENRTQVDEQKEKWRKALQREKVSFLHQLRRQSGEQITRAISDALQSLADESLEERLVHKCLTRLKDQDEGQISEMKHKLSEGDGTIKVSTSWPLEDDGKDHVKKVIRETLADKNSIEFEVSDSITAGMEISVGGRKIAWTLNEYLERIESRLREELSRLERNRQGSSEDEKQDQEAEQD